MDETKQLNSQQEAPPDVGVVSGDDLATHEGRAEVDRAVSCYAEFLGGVATDLPEVALNNDILLAAGRDIIHRNKIGYEFFADRGRALVFASLANRLVSAADNSDDREFVDNAIALLAHQYSSSLYERVAAAEEMPSPPTDRQLRIIERYTNAELTEELRAAVKAGLLKDVEVALGIAEDKDNQDDYEIRVLNVGDVSTAGAITAPSMPDWDSLEGDFHAKTHVLDEAIGLQQAVKAWKTGLVDRAQALGVKWAVQHWLQHGWIA